MLTIKEIAELANVSRGTVDKVLNNRPGVKAETKTRILKIAKDWNYKPNYLGKALVQSKEKIKIGVILTPEYNPYVREIIEAIHRAQDEIKVFGFEVTIKMLNSLDPNEQIGILEKFENEKYAGLAVFPLNNKRVVDKINQLSNQGIAVVTFNSRMESIRDICFVGQDHYKGGQTAAGLMHRLLPLGGEVAVIISSNQLSCHQERLQGFSEKIENNFPDIRIVTVDENQDRIDDALNITEGSLKEHPNLRGIYITGGGVFGVGKALEMTGNAGQVKVICHDLVPDSLELLKKGVIDFAIGQNPELQGSLIVKLLFDYLLKKIKPKQKVIDVPIDIFTDDNI